MATTDKQNALKDAMERAKQIAAKLHQQKQSGGTTSSETPALGGDENRKRGLRALMDPSVEPDAKRIPVGIVNCSDPKSMAQQLANSLVQRAGFGFQLVEETTIPNKLVGLVIGRGGEMINKLQSESGAKVQVAPDPTPDLAGLITERKITISGSTDSVNKAKALIDEIRNGKKIPERLMGGTRPGEFSIEMSIANGKVGLVIGKGGETIKNLQERAGCKMVLFQDGPYANAPEKPLRISGEQSAVMYGKQLVQDLLTSKELEGITTQRENYKELEVPKEAVGLIIGAKGANIQQIQDETGCRLQFKNDSDGETKTAMITGNPQQLAAAEAKIVDIINTNMGSRGRKLNWGNNTEPPQFNGTVASDGQMEMIIEVPANKCGLVIGKGGETIKFIHDESKVNIEINRDIQDASPVRAFQVKGTREMIDKALSIIREKTNDNSIGARPIFGSEPPQDQWGAPANGGMGFQQQPNHPWGQQQQEQQQPHQEQPPWPEPPQQQQQHQYQPQQRAPSHEQPSRDQQSQGSNIRQSRWDPQPQSHQEQHSNQQSLDRQGQPAQGQHGRPQQDQLASHRNAAEEHPAAPGTASQPDYSAEWAQYYEQQRQQQQQQQLQPQPQQPQQYGQHGHHGQQHEQQQQQQQRPQQHEHQQYGHQQPDQQQDRQQPLGHQQQAQQQYGQQRPEQQRPEQQRPEQQRPEQQQYGQQQHGLQQHGLQQHGQQERGHEQRSPHEQRRHDDRGREQQPHQQQHPENRHFQQHDRQQQQRGGVPSARRPHSQSQEVEDYQDKLEDFYKSIGKRH